MALTNEYQSYMDLKAINNWQRCYFVTTPLDNVFQVHIPEHINQVNLSFTSTLIRFAYLTKDNYTLLICRSYEL